MRVYAEARVQTEQEQKQGLQGRERDVKMLGALHPVSRCYARQQVYRG